MTYEFVVSIEVDAGVFEDTRFGGTVSLPRLMDSLYGDGNQQTTSDSYLQFAMVDQLNNSPYLLEWSAWIKETDLIAGTFADAWFGWRFRPSPPYVASQLGSWDRENPSVAATAAGGLMAQRISEDEWDAEYFRSTPGTPFYGEVGTLVSFNVTDLVLIGPTGNAWRAGESLPIQTPFDLTWTDAINDATRISFDFSLTRFEDTNGDVLDGDVGDIDVDTLTFRPLRNDGPLVWIPTPGGYDYSHYVWPSWLTAARFALFNCTDQAVTTNLRLILQYNGCGDGTSLPVAVHLITAFAPVATGGEAPTYWVTHFHWLGKTGEWSVGRTYTNDTTGGSPTTSPFNYEEKCNLDPRFASYFTGPPANQYVKRNYAITITDFSVTPGA